VVIMSLAPRLCRFEDSFGKPNETVCYPMVSRSWLPLR
jgi:hypothetical protein